MRIKKKALLNLGCGSRYHPSWVNVDLNGDNKEVAKVNIVNGLPFNSSSFAAIYCSHLLEHLPKTKAPFLLKECFRVLIPGGIIRVVVPDLEVIAKLYIEKLQKALEDDENAKNDYEWIVIELLDQMTRRYPGGEAMSYLTNSSLINTDFVFSRWGLEAKKNLDCNSLKDSRFKVIQKIKPIKKILKSIFYKLFFALFRFNYEEAKFMQTGENHLWMYDRYSLKKILENSGFIGSKIITPFESEIPDWNEYMLDGCNGIAYKPDSIYMEARKP